VLTITWGALGVSVRGGDQVDFRVHPAGHNQPVSAFEATGMKGG
jgi:hypothetical protein